MEITSTHRIDKSEPDENGVHDYCYEYDILRKQGKQQINVLRKTGYEPL